VIANPAVSSTTVWPVGFWWSELTHPCHLFVGHGLEVAVFSLDGGRSQQVMALATLIGFDVIDMGPLGTAGHLEPLAMVWIHLANKQGHGRRFAQALLSRA